MEYYCPHCGGRFKSAKFDHVFERCHKCSRSVNKRERKRKIIFDEYAHVQVGDMMEWSGQMCIVTGVHDDGWTVFVPMHGRTGRVYVWGSDNLEDFRLRFRQYQPPSKTDKN
jgi:hypothetical protein